MDTKLHYLHSVSKEYPGLILRALLQAQDTGSWFHLRGNEALEEPRSRTERPGHACWSAVPCSVATASLFHRFPRKERDSSGCPWPSGSTNESPGDAQHAVQLKTDAGSCPRRGRSTGDPLLSRLRTASLRTTGCSHEGFLQGQR